MRSVVRVLILIVLTFSFSECSRILGIFPSPEDHVSVMYQNIVKDLLARGHQLTTITASPIVNHPNITQIDVRGIYEKEIDFVDCNRFWDEESVYGMSYCLTRHRLNMMDKAMSHPDVAKLIKNPQKFDLVVFEYQPEYLLSVMFTKIFYCPVIGITPGEASNMIHDDFGNEWNLATHPEPILGYLESRVSLFEKIYSLYYYWKESTTVVPTYLHHTKLMMEKYFVNITDYPAWMKKEIQLLMINTSPALQFIRPLTPKTIQLGGFMNIEAPKQLPNGTLKTFLDQSTSGAIYVNLGNVSISRRKIYLKAFKKLKRNVVWQFDANLELPNVLVGKFPEGDVLAHPNIKLFITEADLQSFELAIDRAVPMLAVPNYGEQFSNAEKIDEMNIGRKMEKKVKSSYIIESNIDSVIASTSIYKTEITKLREIVYDQPMTSRERAIWWCEHVIRRNGTNHLEYLGGQMPLLSKLYVDVMIIIFCLFLWMKRLIPWILRKLKSLLIKLAPVAIFVGKFIWNRLSPKIQDFAIRSKDFSLRSWKMVKDFKKKLTRKSPEQAVANKAKKAVSKAEKAKKKE